MNAKCFLEQVESMELVGYAVPTPDQLEFTYADPSTCDLPRFPAEVKQEVLNMLKDENVLLFKVVATELGTHGNGIAVALLVPHKGQIVAESQERD